MKKLFTATALLLAMGAGCSTNVNVTPNDNGSTGTGDDNGQAICQNMCGNGSCEAIVCEGTGCPCAETIDSCPQDCSDPNSNNQDVSDLIQVTSPTMNEQVDSPLIITGKARGTWYFEASFPIKIYDANNNLLGTTTAAAQSDWMTEDFVNFTASLNFTLPTTTTGTIVLHNDNPSGLPQNDKSLTIPVTF